MMKIWNSVKRAVIFLILWVVAAGFNTILIFPFLEKKINFFSISSKELLNLVWNTSSLAFLLVYIFMFKMLSKSKWFIFILSYIILSLLLLAVFLEILIENQTEIRNIL